jgi:hypothetical protein
MHRLERIMTLPIDIVGSIWLVAKEIWEWEIDPVPPPDTSTSDAPASWTTGCDPSPGPEWRLVFKGYEYTHSYSWSFAESALSRPWLHQRGDEPEPRAADDKTGPLDAAAKIADDGDAPL